MRHSPMVDWDVRRADVSGLPSRPVCACAHDRPAIAGLVRCAILHARQHPGLDCLVWISSKLLAGRRIPTVHRSYKHALPLGASSHTESILYSPVVFALRTPHSAKETFKG